MNIFILTLLLLVRKKYSEIIIYILHETHLKFSGFCEIIGGFVGFMILLYCKNKWKIVGGFTAITGLVNCLIWILPSYCIKYS